MEIKSYLNESVKNGYLLRWTRMPITVYIAPMKFYSKQGEEAAYRRLVEKALKSWEIVSEGLIKFKMVNSLYDSQINIDWKRVERTALGHCTYNYDNKMRLYGADVSIGLTDGKIHQAYDSQNEVYHTILHEMGHALGLGHSPYENDIMYTPHKYGVIELSDNDIFSIQCLYSFPAGKSVKQIGAQYSVMTDHDIDLIIRKLDEKYADEIAKENGFESDNENYLPIIHKKERDLLDEANGLAEIQKYNLSIQNVGLTEKMQEFFKSQHRDSRNNQKKQ